MIGRCPGCGHRLPLKRKKSGIIRYVDDRGVSREMMICESCSEKLEEMDDYSVSIPRD